jgi:hypothetical protein
MNQQQAVLRSTHSDLSPVSERKRGLAAPLWLGAAAVSLAAVLWLFLTRVEYTPGSDLGYNLGLVGGVAMLLTLLYPVCKRVRFLYSWVQMKHWFHAHMVLGIAGPILVLFHSKLSLESVNGTLAFVSMWLVFFSGFTGRYLYTRIHQGLADSRALLEDLKRNMGISAEDVRPKLHFAPRAVKQLEKLEASVLAPSTGLLSNLGNFLILPIRIRCTYLSACSDVKKAIRTRARERGWNSRKARQRAARGKRLIWVYLEAIRSVARSVAYERLFSLWHIVHIPLLFWLAITGAIHVLAVHMY